MLSGFELKMLRIKKRVIQREIAEEMGVTRNWISMIENETRFLNEEQYTRYLKAIYKHENQDEIKYKGRKKKAKQEIEEIEELEKAVDKQVKL